MEPYFSEGGRVSQRNSDSPMSTRLFFFLLLFLYSPIAGKCTSKPKSQTRNGTVTRITNKNEPGVVAQP